MEFNKSQTHKPEAFELVFIKKKDLTQHILVIVSHNIQLC